MTQVYRLLIAFLLFHTSGYCQTSFKSTVKKADPVKLGSAFSSKQKIIIHENYLKQAVAEKNITKQLYATIFLTDDKLGMQDYPDFARYAIQAENLARLTGNKSAQGNVKIKLGWVDFIVHEDMRASIKKMQAGVKLCTEAKDSLCVAECQEQMATMYAHLEIFDSAHYYYNLAIPVLKRYSDSNLSSAYNNYTNLLSYQGRSVEALPYIDTAIDLARSQHNVRMETVYLTNRALFLYEIKRHPEALQLLQKCMVIDKRNGWLDNLVYDFYGLAVTNYETGDYRQAYDFIEKYHSLKDSLLGASTKNKVARLIALNDQQEKELVLQRKQLELAVANKAIANRTWLIVVFIIAIGIGVWRWFALASIEKKKRQESLQSLADLTAILLEKNTALSTLKEQITSLEHADSTQAASPVPKAEQSPIVTDGNSIVFVESEDADPSLYNRQILTPADWSAFKIYFEKAFPGYLLRLRDSYSSMTPAEERIFLLTKLNLTRTEAASMLGISVDSVKKTRLRLRKRLGLNEDVDLDEFVKGF